MASSTAASSSANSVTDDQQLIALAKATQWVARRFDFSGHPDDRPDMDGAISCCYRHKETGAICRAVVAAHFPDRDEWFNNEDNFERATGTAFVQWEAAHVDWERFGVQRERCGAAPPDRLSFTINVGDDAPFIAALATLKKVVAGPWVKSEQYKREVFDVLKQCGCGGVKHQELPCEAAVKQLQNIVARPENAVHFSCVTATKATATATAAAAGRNGKKRSAVTTGVQKTTKSGGSSNVGDAQEEREDNNETILPAAKLQRRV